jgi:Flp pilus assembly protein TadG
MVALTKDERGVTVVTFVLVLPIFLLIIFGMFEVWKIMSVRESLHLGMLRAATYLTSEGRYLPDRPEDWED